LEDQPSGGDGGSSGVQSFDLGVALLGEDCLTWRSIRQKMSKARQMTVTRAAIRRLLMQNSAATARGPAHRPDPLVRLAVAGRRARISVERPERPTWCGDRINAVSLRLERDHHLDPAIVWPFLEPALPASCPL
jgi:hypothetical protein